MDYKKKNIILLCCTVFLLFIIYAFSIRKTLNYKYKYENLLAEKEKIENSVELKRKLKKRVNEIEYILKSQNISVSNSFQQILLKKINAFKKDNNLSLIKFDNSIKVKDQNIDATLYPITVKSDFNTLLSFLSYIEQQNLGELKNIQFLKKKNYRTTKNYLILKFYLKKIKINN